MSSAPQWPGHLRRAGLALLKDSHRTSLELFKIMVPVIIVVKLLKELGVISWLALPLEPFMEFMGLPAQTGLVWATALVMNLYSAIAVYAALLPDMQPLSAAQITVLATVMLIAHNLPVELRIAQRCGLSLWTQAALRVGGALACGFLLHLFLTSFGLLQHESAMLFTPDNDQQGLLPWIMGQARNLAAIYVIILALMAMVRLLQHFRVTDLLGYLLKPLLRLMGIGQEAATITVLGLVLGIAYGGGLIIHEVRSGKVPRKDVFASMSLMGLSHALIEDTLLMALVGAHALGTLWFRALFSLLVVALLSRLYLKRKPTPAPGNAELQPS